MECALCHEHVTNPLCPDCLAQAIAQWLGHVAPERIAALEEMTDSFRDGRGVRCIRCKQRIDVCTYCYTKHIFNWLREGNLQREFLEYFNFDLYRLAPYDNGN